MRLVSLAPSATATLAAMDAGAGLVGATVHCDLDAVGTVTEPEHVGGWLNPDLDRVAQLDPDLVLTSDALQRDIRDELKDRGRSVYHREPGTLEEAIEGFATLGDAVGATEAGERLAADSRERLEQVRAAVADEPTPTVYCEEWSDPPMVAGNWVPEAVEAAGGAYPFVNPGERSREVSAEEVEAADPEHIVLHLCGHGETVDPGTFRARGWAPDAAVHVVDDATLNQPSPRLLDGIERLATLFHGDVLAEAYGPATPSSQAPRTPAVNRGAMRIAVGSGNPVKRRAVETAVESMFSDPAVEAVAVDSGVSEQPRGQAETVTGAGNRAANALASGEYDLGVGLEGGVAEFADTEGLYLIMWATVTDGEQTGRGSGPSFRLPDSIAERVDAGEELGPVMDDVLGEDDVAKNQGAAGALSAGVVDRDDALAAAVAAAMGPFVTEHY